MPSTRVQARWLATSLRTGAWNRAGIADRLTRALPAAGVDSGQLAARLAFHFEGPGPPAFEPLVDYLLDEPLLQPAFAEGAATRLLVDSPPWGAPADRPVTFPLPELATHGDVGQWLGLRGDELAWFADSRQRQASCTRSELHHYRYAWTRKRSGGLRLIEAPKSRLKAIQRRILTDILNRVPPHPAAHGFTRGRSTLSYASPHVGQRGVLRLDLQDFFHSVPIARVGAVFRRLGYPFGAASTLQGLCANSVSPVLAGPRFRDLTWSERKRLQSPHLAQGAPTSPALANLCAWRLDCRLEGLAAHHHLQYTRYADDLAFSGPTLSVGLARFLAALVGAIAAEEGFAVNHRKTRVQRASQRQSLAGVVINRKPNTVREDYDRLRATLHNCARHGPASQNRDGHPDFEAHLRGRVSHVARMNPARATKLHELWIRIDWSR
ncbi:MAG: RNA-directed DNA polymerase [Ectothiorhodospiraceae bacterium]|nr:RNA-directed DNA polymerase [Ectothiorhodospiraceae bacterium]